MCWAGEMPVGVFSTLLSSNWMVLFPVDAY